MDRVLKACKSSKVAPGIAFGRNTEQCKEFIGKGYRFIAVGLDTGFMATGIDQVLKQLKG